jgi:hypothetical protein
MTDKNFALYRKSKIGESLQEALTEMIDKNEIPSMLEEKILRQFDKVSRI